MIKVSVITPIYNREMYLSKAIETLKAQTLKEIEFIIVDDGSTDNTLTELKKGIGKDKRFKIIGYKGNKGPSYARNQGLKAAKGEYIGFFDIDDYIPENYYEVLYKTAQKCDSDVLVATIGERPKKLVDRLNLLRKGSIWDKIYRHSFLKENNITFFEGYFTADTLFTVQVACLAKSFNVTEETRYRYKLQPDSIGFDKKYVKKRKKDIIVVVQTIKDFIQKQSLSSEEIEAIKSFIQRCYAGYSNDSAFQEKLYQEIGLEQPKNKEESMFLLKLAKSLHIINSKKYKELRAIKQFQQSNLFDAEWYLKTYPDVANSEISPERHYYKYGWKEGRNPSPLFDGNAYLKENWDVKDSGKNPLEHYLISGQYEGRYYTSINGKVDSQSVESTHHSPKEHLNLMKKIRYALEYPIRLQEECERLKAEINELEKQLKK